MVEKPNIIGSDTTLKITKALYDWCVKHRQPVPPLIKTTQDYYWIDISNNKVMDEILLWADFWRHRGNNSKRLCMASSALFRSYSKHTFDKGITL